MRRNITLLSIPPIIALALLALNHENKEITQAKHTSATTATLHIDGTTATSSTKRTQPLASSNSPIKDTRSQEQHSDQLSGIAQLRAIKNKTALHNAVLKDHENFARYPSNNAPIERKERDPVTMTYQPQERSSLSDDELSSLTAWTDKKYLNQGQSITINARLDEQGQQGLDNALIGTVFLQETRNMQDLEFSDLDNDGVYSATISTETTETWPLGIYKVLIASSYKKLTESVSFVISPPAVKLTGEYKERINDQGALEYQIEIETTERARYYVRASLYSATNSPIGSSQFSDHLSSGKHWVPLSFSGRMIHDAAESGPYEINTVELALAGIPMLRMPPAKANFYSDSYTLDQFSELTYQEQQELIRTSAP